MSSQVIKSATKNISKSKRKLIADPKYELSLVFSNNLLQTYLFEIFEKMKINLNPVEISYNNISMPNLLKIYYNNETSFLLFIDKEFLKESLSSNNKLIHILETLPNLTPSKNITFIFMDIPTTTKLPDIKVDDLIFFLNCEAKVKVVTTSGNNELIDFLSNYIDSISKKEDKSKITFFDSKPVTSTNLCELENITDQKTIMFVKHLMCIPGISERKAISIVKEYPYLSNLMEVYLSSDYTDNEKENFLKDTIVTDKSKNTNKKLGSALSIKVYKTFSSANPSAIIN